MALGESSQIPNQESANYLGERRSEENSGLRGRVNFRCRLCWQIACIVVLSIAVIEAIILVPSFVSFEHDALQKTEAIGLTAVRAGFRKEQAKSLADRLSSGSALLNLPEIAGLALYDLGDAPEAKLGEAPELSLVQLRDSGDQSIRSHDGNRMYVLYERGRTGLPFDIVASLDTSWIKGELTSFVWRIIGLVLLITFFVSLATLLVVDRWILRPIRNIREKLVDVWDDPNKADSFLLHHPRSDELGDMTTALNILVRRLSTYRHSEVLAREHRFQDFATATSDWFWEMDENLRFSYFSERFTEITGVDTAILLGKTREETGVPYVDLEQWERHLNALHSREPFRNFVHPRKMPDGRVVWLSINGVPYNDGDGNFMGFRGTGTDITERIEAEIGLMKSREVAERANRAKSEFLANMSHELRTPLNSILGFSEVIKEQTFGPVGNAKYKEYATAINHSGTHLYKIIGDILEISKIEAGKETLEESKIDVLAVLQECISMVEASAKCDESLVQLVQPINVPALLADERHVKQIALNLLSNAIKFSPSGESIKVGARLTGKSCVEIFVADSGMGIAEVDIPGILEPFGQAAESQVRNHDGMGLGLPICKSLMNLHGGSLRIESEAGTGTTVFVTFPPERTMPSQELLSSA